jgi:hypothetical protein
MCYTVQIAGSYTLLDFDSSTLRYALVPTLLLLLQPKDSAGAEGGASDDWDGDLRSGLLPGKGCSWYQDTGICCV